MNERPAKFKMFFRKAANPKRQNDLSAHLGDSGRGSSLASLPKNVAIFTAAYVLINLPAWLTNYQQFLSRPWFNVDFLLAFYAIAIRRYSLGAALLVLFAALDAAVSTSRTFHFGSIVEFIETVKFAHILNLASFISAKAVAVIVCLILVSISVYVLLHRIQASAKSITVAAFIIVAIADVVNGSSLLSTADTRIIKSNIAFSPIVKTAISIWKNRSPRPLIPSKTTAATNAFLDIPRWMKANPTRSVVLVVVESWGQLEAPAVQAWLDARLDVSAALAYREPQRHLVPFSGPTTNGELRELCNLTGSYALMSQAEGRQCLPSVLSHQGVRTIGLHGFSGNMFDRYRWWPLIGLNRQLFAEQLLESDVQTCGGAFAGACDRQVIERAFIEAASPPQTFVYVLTLNSHIPLASTTKDGELINACQSDNVGMDACNLTNQLGIVMQAVATEVSKSGSAHPLVILVGDHTPPFADKKTRSRYKSDVVPAIALIPR